MTRSSGMDPARLRRWTRRLTSALARHREVPVRVEARVGDGLNLILHHANGDVLQVRLGPRGAVGQAYHRGRFTDLTHAGGRGRGRGRSLRPLDKAWVRLLCEGLGRTEAISGWRTFLREAANAPQTEEPGAGPGPARRRRITSGDSVLIRINQQCQARCAFCNATGTMEDLLEDPRAIREHLESALVVGRTSVSFTGGEPCLRGDLPELVALARSLGAPRVDLQTNGVLLGRGDLVARLSDAGLTSIFLSLHSAAPGVHDAMLKLEGAHEQALRGAQRCLEHGIEVCLNCVLTPQNLAGPAGPTGLVELAAQRLGEVGVRLSFAAPEGRALDHPEVVPRLSEAVHPMARALETGRQLGLEVRIPGLCGVPLCQLPGFETHFDEYHDTEAPPDLMTRTKVERCAECPHEPRCSGFWRTYLGWHGADELGWPGEDE